MAKTVALRADARFRRRGSRSLGHAEPSMARDMTLDLASEVPVVHSVADDCRQEPGYRYLEREGS
jgi:hypothetical protein